MEKLEKRIRYACLCVVLFCVAAIGLLAVDKKQGDLVGRDLIELMYKFDNLSELSANYKTLQSILTDECYASVDIDSDGRAIDGYFRFKTESTDVKPVYDHHDIIVYSIDNPHISPNILYMLQYEKPKHGKVEAIEEYKLVYVCKGGNGVF